FGFRLRMEPEQERFLLCATAKTQPEFARRFRDGIGRLGLFGLERPITSKKIAAKFKSINHWRKGDPDRGEFNLARAIERNILQVENRHTRENFRYDIGRITKVDFTAHPKIDIFRGRVEKIDSGVVAGKS